MRAQVDQIFAQFDKSDSPGCVLGVIKDGQLVYKRGYGMADLDHEVPIQSDTAFDIASLSKQFTSFAILLLAQQGKLSLDDNVQKYIPELRELRQPITIRHLLHHTSGLRDQWTLLELAGWRLGDEVVRDEDILDLVARMKHLNFTPGDQHDYSNTGYTLLGRIVKTVSGQSLREFAEANIFKPLGMRQTVWRDDHAMVIKHQAYGYYPERNGKFKLSMPNYDTVGASGVVTTIEDLAKWDQNFYNKKIGGERVISEMESTTTLNNGDRIYYALGLIINNYRGLKVVEHSGGAAGYSSHIMRFPDRHLSIACLCNHGEANARRLARQVADLYVADFVLPAKVPPTERSIAVAQAVAQITEQEIKDKEGVYWDITAEEWGRVWLDEGKLQLSLAGLKATLVPITGNRFRITEPPGEAVFEAGHGKRMQLTLNVSVRALTRMDRMPPPNMKNFGEFDGEYYSEEIDSTYRVKATPTKLVVTRKRAEASELTPIFQDTFQSSGILRVIRFTRDARNRVSGFRLSADRVRNLLFVKLGHR